MGVELAVAVVSLAVAGASTYAANQQAKKSASAQKEASNISAASERNREADARRQQIREQRIRVAQVEQSAQNTGVTSSSGEIGSLSALSTNAGANLASMSGQGMANQGIAQQNQAALNAQVKQGTYQAVGGFAGSLFGATSGSLVAAGNKLFGTQPKSTAAGQTAAAINK